MKMTSSKLFCDIICNQCFQPWWWNNNIYISCIYILYHFKKLLFCNWKHQMSFFPVDWHEEAAALHPTASQWAELVKNSWALQHLPVVKGSHACPFQCSQHVFVPLSWLKVVFCWCCCCCCFFKGHRVSEHRHSTYRPMERTADCLHVPAEEDWARSTWRARCHPPGHCKVAQLHRHSE